MKTCTKCPGLEEHEDNQIFCRKCGEALTGTFDYRPLVFLAVVALFLLRLYSGTSPHGRAIAVTGWIVMAAIAVKLARSGR